MMGIGVGHRLRALHKKIEVPFKFKIPKSFIFFGIVSLILFESDINMIAQTKSKVNLEPILTKSGGYRILAIELEETSGPVSPEFRYDLKIQILATREGFFIQRTESKANKEPKSVRKLISESTYKNIMTNLLSMGIHSFVSETLPETRILGISYNTVKYTIGGKTKIFYYRLQDLENSKFKHKNDIISYLKRIK